MKPWLHKIEIVVDKAIPLLLIILLALIVSEFWFHNFAEKYRGIIDGIDSFIVLVFVLDLIFKYLRIRNFPKFLRASWLDILAIFPFFLIFRVLEGLVGVFEAGEIVTRTQKVVHVGLELETEVGGALKEGERLAKETSRAERLGRFLRPLARSIRFSKYANKDIKTKTKKELTLETKYLVTKSQKIGIKARKQLEKGQAVLVEEVKGISKEITRVPRYIKGALFFEKPLISKHLVNKLSKLKN